MVIVVFEDDIIRRDPARPGRFLGAGLGGYRHIRFGKVRAHSGDSLIWEAIQSGYPLYRGSAALSKVVFRRLWTLDTVYKFGIVYPKVSRPGGAGSAWRHSLNASRAHTAQRH